MNTTTRTTMAAYAALLLAGGVSISIPVEKSIPTAQAGMMNAEGDIVYLTGIVRDFRTDHDDFEVSVGSNAGHYAGNIVYGLPSDARPVFDGDGFQVRAEWSDSVHNPIAPHLFSSGGVLKLTSAPSTDNQSVLDTFDSSRGPYGGGNVGPAPSIQLGAEMPVLTEPTGLPPFIEELKYDQNHGETTISTDIHCDKFLVSNHHTIHISGNVTMLVEEEFKLQNHADLELLPNSTLTLYVKKVLTIQDQSEANLNTSDPNRFLIYNLGTEPFIVQNQTGVYATVVSPNAILHVQDGSHFYGKFTGESLHAQNQAGIHLDESPAYDSCGGVLSDIAGASSGANRGAITSAGSYSEWYRDVLGTNLSAHHTIALTRNGDGVYEYIDPAFLPIDDKLFGNEGAAHNYNFTYLVSAEFTYNSCTGQFVEFEGADDAWLYIDGQMVLDIAGITPNTNQHIGLDRLGLTDGQEYTFALYYAQRQSVQAAFGLRTNLDLERSSNLPTASPEFD